MKTIFTIAQWEYMNRIKSKLFLISTFFIPLFIIGATVLPALLMDETSETYRIGLIDETNQLGQEFTQKVMADHKLEDGASVYQIFSYTDADSAKQALVDKILDGFMIIPDSIMINGNMGIYVRSAGNFKLHSGLRQTLNKVVIQKRLAENNLDPQLIDRITRRIRADVFEVSSSGEASQSDEMTEFLSFFLVVMLLYMSLMISVQILMRSVIEERASRMVEVLISSITPTQLMSGKILGLGGLGLTQLLFYLLAGIIISSFKGMNLISIEYLVVIIVFFSLGYLFYSTIFATIGSLFDSEQEAGQMVGIISILMVVPIVLSTFIITNPSATATKVMTFIPPMTPFLVLMRFGSSSISHGELAAAVLLMVISIWGMMLLAGKIFRTAILLYGKRITLPEIIRWMKV